MTTLTTTTAPQPLSLSIGRVAKNTGSQLAGYALTWGTRAGIAVLVARSFGPRGLGEFSIAWTAAGILAFLAPLGLGTRLVRERNRPGGAPPDETSHTLGLALVTGTAIAVAAGLAPFVLGVREALVLPLVGAAVFVALSAPAIVLAAEFTSRERMELNTLTDAIESVVALAGVLAALAAGAGVAGVLFGLAGGRAANVVVAAAVHRRLGGRTKPQMRPARWKGMLRTSVPMGAGFVLTSLVLRFDIVLLGAMRPARDVGIYSAASVVVMAIPVVAGTLSGSLYPVLCRAGGLDDPDLQRLVRTVWRVLLASGVVAAAASATLAGPVIGLLYGDAFAPAVAVMALLAWVLPMRFCNGLLGHTLNAVGRQAPRTIAVGVAAVVNLVANLALIPVLGYRGAVWATLATEVVLTAGLLHALRGLRLPVLRPLAEGGAVAAGVAVLLAIAVGGAG